jgi:hypothetical protein
MEAIGICYGNLVYFEDVMVTSYILIFFPVLIYCTKRNLTTLFQKADFSFLRVQINRFKQ